MATVRQHFKYAVTGKFDAGSPQEMSDSQLGGSRGGGKTASKPAPRTVPKKGRK